MEPTYIEVNYDVSSESRKHLNIIKHYQLGWRSSTSVNSSISLPQVLFCFSMHIHCVNPSLGYLLVNVQEATCNQAQVDITFRVITKFALDRENANLEI